MRFFLLIVFYLLLTGANGQLETKNWFIYENHIAVTPSGVTTGLGTPSNISFPIVHKSASISDAGGSLLLASNGNSIIDRNMNVMPALTNINLLGGNGKVMIQQIPNSTRYYVFYVRQNNTANSNSSWTLQYALVDLSLNSGNGDVVSYNQVIDTSSSPSFTLVQGDDPARAWLVTHRSRTDSFFTYPVINTGLGTSPVISRAGTVNTLSEYIFRDLKTSFDGKMIGGVTYYNYTVFFANTSGFVEVFNFNPANGTVTSKVRTRRTSAYFSNFFSLEFSPDNRLLYVMHASRIYGLQPCGFGSGALSQYNLCYTDSIDFEKYRTVVASDFRFCFPELSWGHIQLGADKKIHMPYTGNTISTINFPNRIGSYSTHVFNSYTLPNNNNGYVSAPDFHHKLMEKAVKNNIVYEGGCHPNPISFRVTNDTIMDIEWNFGDPTSGNNTSTSTNPSHVFSAPGIFTVTAKLYNSQHALIETISELIEIKNPGRRLLFNYPTDTTLCQGDRLRIRLQVVNGIYYWYKLTPGGIEYSGMTSDSIDIAYTETWYVRMKQNDCNGCTMLDSIRVTILPKPNFTLGTDRNLCQGDSILLQVTDPDARFIWSTGDTSNSIWVHQGGLYWLEAEYNNNGCPMRDSVVITQVPGVLFSLPGDTTLCNSQTLQLVPGVPNANYLWQNGSTQQQFTVSQPGNYWVRITSANGCYKSDTIQVSYINAQQVYLGNDSTLCAGSSLALQAGVNNAQYLWSTGATTQGISVSQSGTYWIRVDNGVCTVTDTINLSFNPPPVVFLGNDTILCLNEQLILNPGIANASYTWQDGSQTNSLTVTQPGLYWIELRKNGCIVSDSIQVGYYNVPAINLGPDTRFCNGDSLQLNAGTGFLSYSWSNGNTTSSMMVHLQGNYSVTATTVNGCKTRDTIQILNLYPLPVVNFGPDGNLCSGTIRNLNAGPGFTRYTWSNGTSSQAINVSSIGTYWVVVQDQQGCRGGDTLNILAIDSLPKSFLPTDTAICNYGNLNLKPLSSYDQYTWSNGSNGSSISITQPGTYWLDVIDNNRCHGRDTIVVTPKECIKGLYVPSGFTPNNDGKNDYFKPMLFGNIQEYSFTIYNRWGMVVFQSTVPGNGWDGRLSGQLQLSEAFVWICRYKLENEAVQFAKGTVLLIR